MSTNTLINKIAAGDGKALERLYAEYKNLVFAVAVSVVRNRADAEDIAADTFVSVMTKAGDFRGGSGKAWLVSIAKHLALNALKKNARAVPTDFTLNESLYGEYRIEEDFADNLALKAALTVLSGEEREITLLYNAGMKHREIAEATGMPLGTVTWKYKTALTKLRKYLEEGGGKNEK